MVSMLLLQLKKNQTQPYTRQSRWNEKLLTLLPPAKNAILNRNRYLFRGFP